MIDKEKFLIIFLLISFQSFSVFGLTLKCVLENNECVSTFIDDSQVDEWKIYFESNSITDLNLHGFSPFFNRSFCAEFPNLQYISTFETYIQEMNEMVFEDCNNLVGLFLHDNNFQKLERNTFKGLTNLHHLYIDGGNIPFLDLDFTDLKELQELKISNLSLTEFSPDLLREQSNLEDFSMNNNELVDFNFEQLLYYAPNLKNINFADNYITDSRINEMETLMTSDKQTTSMPYPYFFFAPRIITFDNYDGSGVESDMETTTIQSDEESFSNVYDNIMTIRKNKDVDQAQDEKISALQGALKYVMSFLRRDNYTTGQDIQETFNDVLEIQDKKIDDLVENVKELQKELKTLKENMKTHLESPRTELLDKATIKKLHDSDFLNTKFNESYIPDGHKLSGVNWFKQLKNISEKDSGSVIQKTYENMYEKLTVVLMKPENETTSTT